MYVFTYIFVFGFVNSATNAISLSPNLDLRQQTLPALYLPAWAKIWAKMQMEAQKKVHAGPPALSPAPPATKMVSFSGLRTRMPSSPLACRSCMDKNVHAGFGAVSPEFTSRPALLFGYKVCFFMCCDSLGGWLYF